MADVIPFTPPQPRAYTVTVFRHETRYCAVTLEVQARTATDAQERAADIAARPDIAWPVDEPMSNLTVVTFEAGEATPIRPDDPTEIGYARGAQ